MWRPAPTLVLRKTICSVLACAGVLIRKSLRCVTSFRNWRSETEAQSNLQLAHGESIGNLAKNFGGHRNIWLAQADHVEDVGGFATCLQREALFELEITEDRQVHVAKNRPVQRIPAHIPILTHWIGDKRTRVKPGCHCMDLRGRNASRVRGHWTRLVGVACKIRPVI